MQLSATPPPHPTSRPLALLKSADTPPTAPRFPLPSAPEICGHCTHRPTPPVPSLKYADTPELQQRCLEAVREAAREAAACGGRKAEGAAGVRRVAVRGSVFYPA